MRGQQQNWKQAGLRPGQLNGRLDDQEHYGSLSLHTPIWRYIISRYYNKNSITGKDDYEGIEINTIGRESISLAIELSQWGYFTRFISPNPLDIEEAKKDAKIQAGKLNYVYAEKIGQTPRAVATCFIGILTERIFYQGVDMRYWLKSLVERSHEVVFAIPQDSWWVAYIHEHYECYIERYPGGKHLFIRIFGVKEDED